MSTLNHPDALAWLEQQAARGPVDDEPDTWDMWPAANIRGPVMHQHPLSVAQQPDNAIYPGREQP